MKENYKPWKLNIENFEKVKGESDKLKFILNFAILAPSSHNSQPWSFEIKENKIYLYKELSRKLFVADANDRQLFISLGAAIKNITVAADYYGYSSKITYQQGNLAAIIELKHEKDIVSDSNHLIHSILKRKTNRNKYKNALIPNNILNEFISLSNEQFRVIVISEEKERGKLADIAVSSSIESMIDKKFRYELSYYIKHNLTNSKTGMPGFTLGLPTPLSFILPSLIRKFNLEKASQKQNKELLKKHTPYIIILATKNDSYIDWLKIGQVYEQISLMATKFGICTSPWGAPIEIKDFYKDIQEVLNIKERPQMFFRIGYPLKESQVSPRLSVNEVMK